MSTTCPRCGVELAALVDPSEHFEQVGGRYVRHDAERCRDRLAARVAELEKQLAEDAKALERGRATVAEIIARGVKEKHDLAELLADAERRLAELTSRFGPLRCPQCGVMTDGAVSYWRHHDHPKGACTETMTGPLIVDEIVATAPTPAGPSGGEKKTSERDGREGGCPVGSLPDVQLHPSGPEAPQEGTSPTAPAGDDCERVAFHWLDERDTTSIGLADLAALLRSERAKAKAEGREEAVKFLRAIPEPKGPTPYEPGEEWTDYWAAQKFADAIVDSILEDALGTEET